MRKKFLLIFFFLPLFAQAVVMIPLNLDKLTQKADIIVLGHCIDKQVYESGKMIWTEYTIRVYEVLKGDAKIKEVKVRQPGGEVGERGIKVSGTVSFLPLEESLLFLKKTSSGAYQPVGWAQGKFKLYYDEKTKKKYARQELGGIAFWKKSKKDSLPPSKIELKELKSQIKAVLKKDLKKK